MEAENFSDSRWVLNISPNGSTIFVHHIVICVKILATSSSGYNIKNMQHLTCNILCNMQNLNDHISLTGYKEANFSHTVSLSGCSRHRHKQTLLLLTAHWFKVQFLRHCFLNFLFKYLVLYETFYPLHS